MNQRIIAQENGKTKMLTIRKAVLQKIAHDALKGDRHAQEMLVKLMNRYLPDEADNPVPPEVHPTERAAQRIKEYMAAVLWDEDLPDDLD